MLLRAQSSTPTSIGRRMIVSLGFYSMWSWFLLPCSMAQPGPKGGAQQGPSEVFRFEVSDAANNRPLPNASVTIALWRYENGVEQKKELESRTDDNGVAVFPKIQIEKLAVTVEAKGYRSISRWINPKDFGRAIRIRLDKWRRVSGG
jgi:hypothetical protein